MTLEGLHEGRLDPADIPAALALSSEPGWNQVAADWQLMLEHGDSFGVTTAEGRVIASGLTVVFDGPFGWISMILVTAAYRRRGIATRLMQLCVEALQRRGLAPSLDASPEGRQVYLRLGFRDVYPTTRMFATAVHGLKESTRETLGIRKFAADDLPAVARYDRAPFGANRAYMLDHLWQRLPHAAFLAERRERVTGFILARDGRICTQLGPLVADNVETALGLLAHALKSIQGPVCLDIADHHPALRRWLEERGFEPVVPFIRMILGRSEPFDDPQRIFVIAGPELG